MTDKKISPLPRSDDEIWDGEKHRSNPVPFSICKNHTKDRWMENTAYKDNGDGTASCEICGWGCRVPGYMRILGGRVVDLRKV